MNSFIETLNQWGENFLSFAWPMLWQSSLLIAALFAFDLLFWRKLRGSIRYALWLVVLVKLCVPPTLALPTSPAWWLHQTPPPVMAKSLPHYTVTYADAPIPEMPMATLPAFVPPAPAMTKASWLLVVSVAVSFVLLGWLLVRWWQITRQVRRATTSERLTELADAAQESLGMKFNVQVKLTTNSMSPAVCGLFRPAIMIPQSLAENFSDEQLRAVLLHELIHLYRRDVWVNFLQAQLQIFYWWHPLVWLANARIRRVREEAVDDAVMLSLRDEAESYAPTLLEVAKLALNRPLVSLGLVGIMESRHALRQRIERLVDFRAPRHAGLTLVSLLGILAFTAVAVPMGEGPAPVEKISAIAAAAVEEQSLTVKVNPENFIRNVKAQAAKYLLSPTNDYTTILVEALVNEGLDCSPPHGLAFNNKAGEITTQNTPEKLEAFRQVIEQLNRADGICELPLRNSPIQKKLVLIQAHIYQMRVADLEKITPGLDFYPSRQGGDSWWSVMPENFEQLIGRVESSGLKPIQRPRIQTWSGMPAQFYVGDGTNDFEFSCTPTANEGTPSEKDGFVNLALHSTVVTGSPGKAAFTNQFTTKASALNRGGLIVRMENFDGHASSNLVVLIRAEILTNTSLVNPAKPRGAVVGKIIGTDTAKLLAEKSASDSSRVMTFKLDGMVREDSLRRALLDAGVKIPPTVFYYSDGGILLVRGSIEQLALVNRALLKLNGTSPAEIEASTTGFSERLAETKPDHGYPTNLFFTRTFKTDEWKFRASLRKAGANISDLTNAPGVVTAAAQKLFSSLGVDWESPVGKSVFYNDRNGMLLVRATAGDLDVVEQAVQAFNYTPPQIHIKARIIRVPKGTMTGFQNFPRLTNTVNGGFTGILSDTNARAVLRALESQKGFETLGEPEVVTMSGRQCQMRATQVITVVTNMVYEEGATNNSIVPQTEKVETGPILDVVPYVMADGYTINLALIPSLTEFLGYEETTNTTAAHNRAGEKLRVQKLPIVIPRFTVRQIVTTVNLWDNQTAIIGGIPETTHVNGSAFTGKPKASDKELLVFITATIVDPAGNRVHADDELPFAQTGVPPQPK